MLQQKLAKHRIWMMSVHKPGSSLSGFMFGTLHIWTLDGEEFSINSFGEHILLRSDPSAPVNIMLQIRTSFAENTDNKATKLRQVRSSVDILYRCDFIFWSFIKVHLQDFFICHYVTNLYNCHTHLQLAVSLFTYAYSLVVSMLSFNA